MTSAPQRRYFMPFFFFFYICVSVVFYLCEVSPFFVIIRWRLRREANIDSYGEREGAGVQRARSTDERALEIHWSLGREANIFQHCLCGNEGRVNSDRKLSHLQERPSCRRWERRFAQLITVVLDLVTLPSDQNGK